MAGRNRNTFLKRQKEIERVQRARAKMARRHGKAARDTAGEAAGPTPEAEVLLGVSAEDAPPENPGAPV